MKYFIAFLARLFMSTIFLVSSINKIFHWQRTEKELIRVLGDWECIVSSVNAHTAIAMMISWAPIFLIIATLLELLGGLLVLLGVRAKLGAFLLILFLIPVTFVFHQFWFLEGTAQEIQISFFLRNLAIVGGLMMIGLYGVEGEKGPSNRFYSD